MGSGASRDLIFTSVEPLQADAAKPPDASDVNDLDACKAELIALRAKVRAAVEHGIQEASKISDPGKDVQDEVDKLLNAAIEIEKNITPLLQELCAKCGGHLVGLEHKFKGRSSLERKISGEIESLRRQNAREHKNVGIDVRAVARTMADVLRYTMLVPEDEYCKTVIEGRRLMTEAGNPAVKMKNYWAPGDMYQGINDLYRNEQASFTFELQYHTPASWDLKSAAHVIYEKFRVSDDPQAQQALFEEGAALAATLKMPDGVLDLPKLVKNAAPDILASYAHIINVNGTRVAGDLLNWFSSQCGENARVKIDVDDEVTVESELRSLVRSFKKDCDVVVRDVYFFGLSISITIPSAEYSERVQKLVQHITETDVAIGPMRVPVKALYGANLWESSDGIGKCVQLLCVHGSRKTQFPTDNILFEVNIHTVESKNAENEVKSLLQMQISNDFNELNRKVRELWHQCPNPTGVTSIKMFSLPAPLSMS